MIYKNRVLQVGDILKNKYGNSSMVLEILPHLIGLSQTVNYSFFREFYTIEELYDQEYEYVNEEQQWIPYKEETYYLIDDGGDVITSNWDNDETDSYRLKMHNVFKTREEAILHDKEHI